MKIAMLGDTQSVNTQSWVQGLEEAGVEVVSWSMPRRSDFLRLLLFIQEIWRLKQWLKTQKPDILIGYRTTSYGFIGALMNYHPYIIAAQGIDDVFSAKWWVNLLSRVSARYAISRADLIHAWAINMVPALIKRGAAKDKILVMPRGIDLNQFAFKRRSFEEKLLRLIVTRSLYPEYHIDVIIDAVALLARQMDIRLTIVGTGPLEAPLKERCRQLGVEENIIFVGRVPNTKIPELLNNNEYYISLPDTEGASASLFEAFACGLFPIVTDLPANRVWIKHLQNGLLLPKIEADALADQILYACQLPAFCQKAVEENRNTAESSLSLQNNMRTMIQYYEQLLTKGKINTQQPFAHLTAAEETIL